jgi:hypothetical protein
MHRKLKMGAICEGLPFSLFAFLFPDLRRLSAPNQGGTSGTPRHTELARYRCSLPGLAGFTGLRCTEPEVPSFTAYSKIFAHGCIAKSSISRSSEQRSEKGVVPRSGAETLPRRPGFRPAGKCGRGNRSAPLQNDTQVGTKPGTLNGAAFACRALARSAQLCPAWRRAAVQRLHWKSGVRTGANVIARMSWLLLLAAFVSGGTPAWAQQVAATGAHATIQCGGEPYVPVTADKEQGLPLQLVDKAACGSQVRVLSDPEGYAVKVRTAAGKVGYIARYQIAIEAAPKTATSSSTADASRSARQSAPAPTAANSSAEQNGPRKPRVYVSDTESWNASDGFSNPSSVAKGALYGGYDPDMVDIYQDFTSDCSTIIVTQKKSDADFAVLFDKGAPKKGFAGLHGLVKVNKVTVLSRSGETLLSNESHSADVAVSMACNAVSQPVNNPASDAARRPH